MMMKVTTALAALSVGLALRVPFMLGASASKIQYKFTVRDFVQGLCMQKSDLANYFEECTSSKKQLCWPQKSWNDPRSKHCEWISTDDIGLGHPDFEINGNVYPNGIAKGIVNNTLFTEHDGLPRPIYCRDSDAKPWCGQLNGKYATTGKSTFDQWYRDVPRVNKRVGITLDLDLDPQLSADGKDVYVFDSKKFSPSQILASSHHSCGLLLLMRSGWAQAIFGSPLSFTFIFSTREARRSHSVVTMTCGCSSMDISKWTSVASIPQ